jgi:hypothetical protein
MRKVREQTGFRKNGLHKNGDCDKKALVEFVMY